MEEYSDVKPLSCKFTPWIGFVELLRMKEPSGVSIEELENVKFEVSSFSPTEYKNLKWSDPDPELYKAVTYSEFELLIEVSWMIGTPETITADEKKTSKKIS